MGLGCGKRTCSLIMRATGTLDISTSRPLPTRNLATSSGLPIVAESPTIWNSLLVICRSRSKARESWLPRLLSANSWTSSTTTHLTAWRCWRRCQPVRSTCNVSGVVISISGGLLDCLVLSRVSVSPCLTASFMSRLLHQY